MRLNCLAQARVLLVPESPRDNNVMNSERDGGTSFRYTTVLPYI